MFTHLCAQRTDIHVLTRDVPGPHVCRRVLTQGCARAHTETHLYARAHARVFLCLLSASTRAPAPAGFCFRSGCKHPAAIPLGRPQEGCGGQHASVGPPGGPHHTRLRESPSTDALYVARWLNLLCDPRHLPCLSEPPYPVPPHPLQVPLAPPPPLGMCLGATAGA